MSGFLYHGALSPLKDACKQNVPEVFIETGLLNSYGLRNPVLRKMMILFRHIGFIREVRSRTEPVLIRDFSNVPLNLVFPFIRKKRKRLRFLVNHNLQWTGDSRAEKAAFSRLIHQGAELVFFEEVPISRLQQLGVPDSAYYCIPHPVPESPVRRSSARGVSTVGVIGQYRPEKGIDDLLEHLEPLAIRYRIVLALPNIGEFKRNSRYANAPWFCLVDTKGHEDYLKAVAACDVIVLNHPAEGYEYRASGLIADAVSADVPVVVRNLPVMKRQISWPVPVGACFDELAQIPECIDRVSSLLSQGKYDFAAYRRSRSVDALAAILTEIFK